MNKVIQQLAKQAWDESPNTANKYVVYTEKLAELIVRECAMVANRAENSDQELRSVYEVVTSHFGVE